MKTYDVVIWKEEGVWTAHSPSVPGVYGLGSTRDIANRDLKEALALLSHYLREIGESLPRSQKLHTSQVCV
jgi:predicted RNase H-like HicB family nuclease